MTTETERRVPEERKYPHRVPEHPGWEPWWIRVAECEGCRVVLVDSTLRPPDVHPIRARYAIAVGPVPCRMASTCDWRDIPHHDISSWHNDLADAEAAFELACERLRQGV